MIKGVARRRRSAAIDPFILSSKLDLPNLSGGVLARPRLLEALAAHADRPLSLVISEAGFGKTVLLASYAASLRRPVVWVSLMASDADAVVFGSYLLAALRREMPRTVRGLERTLEEARTGGGMTRFGTVIANALAARRGPPLLIVLDDFHEVAAEPAVTGMVDLLLRHLPPTARLLIGARTLPPLQLDRLRTRGELFELDSSHLRFTRDELAQLFTEIYRSPLDATQIAALDEATHGWPTAVHLVHESLRRTPDRALETVIEEFRTSTLELHDYLSHEVLGRLEPDERRLLERVATVDRFDAGLAGTLAGLPDARAALQRLARRGVLRTFGEPEGASYQVHDLVRNYLRRQLEAAGGAAAWAALERDTARAFEGRGEPESALRHYLLAGASEEAAVLVSRLARPLLRQGRAGTLLQCLADLPEPLVHGDLELLVTLADCRQLLGQWDAADALYQEALARCQAAGARALECRVLLGMSKVLNMRGRHEQVLGMAERGLAIAEGLDLETQVRLLQRKAGAHFYLGQYSAAVRILDEVRGRLGAAADPELLQTTIHNLAMALAARGRFRDAAREFGAALAHVRGAPSPKAPLYLSNLAFLQAELGELQDARAAAEEGLEAARQFSNRAHEITCLEALAQVLAQAGDLDGALTELRRAETLNQEQRMEMIAADLLALRGRIFCARGQFRRAVGFLEEALEQIRERAGQPRFVEFTATLAWCELRAGRAQVAHDRLAPLKGRADGEENEFQRMRVHYWLAESLIALGKTPGVERHLGAALALVRERGYTYFLGLQAREEPGPLLHALRLGIETDVVAAALAEGGAAMETPLIELLPEASPAVAVAIVAILSEVGGAPSLERLAALTTTRRPLQAAARTARRHIETRLARGAAPAPGVMSARLQLFGPPRLEIDGRAIAASAWRSQRAFQILIYLALHPHGADRDRLLEAFWPGRRLAAGRRNFHPTLSYIRHVLPRAAVAPLQRESETYRLDAAYPLTCDAWDVERAFEAARLAREAPARREALEKALAVARLPFLEGFYADWADDLQTQMRDRLERAHLELGSLLAAADDHEAALASYRRAAEFDAYRESTRAAIVECLVRLGNRRAALVEWDRLKALLHDELAVDPLPETAQRVARALGTEPVAGDRKNGEPNGPQRVPSAGQAALKSQRTG